MHTPFLVLTILALVIVASIITSIVTYLILAGRNKRIRLAEQYQQIGITDGYLNIQASRTENKDDKDNNGKYVHRERYTGQCSRSFYVGKELEHEDIHAKYDNGVLTVTFPKEAKKKVPEEKKFISIEG